MKYSCNLCGYLGDHGPQHNVPGLPLTCSQSADPIEDVPVEIKDQHTCGLCDGPLKGGTCPRDGWTMYADNTDVLLRHVTAKPTHPASHQDGDGRAEAEEDDALLNSMLAKAQAEHEASLAALEKQPAEHREFQRLYLEALYCVRCAMIMFQFQELIVFPRDSGVYSAIMLELANEFTLSGLEFAPVRTMEERKAMLFRAQERMMLTGIKRKLLPAGNGPKQVLDAQGQPVPRRDRRH